jgi:hypothetical protein
MKSFGLVLGLLMATSSLTSLAHPDTQYVRETYAETPQDEGKVPTREVETTFAKDGSLRVEKVRQIGTASYKIVTLTLCQKRQQIRFSPDLKLYSIVPLVPKGSQTSTSPMSTSGNEQPEGKIIIATTVKDLGEEVVAGVMTRHYRVEENWQRSGSAGTDVQPHTSEIWIAPNLKQPWYCEAEQLEPERPNVAAQEPAGQRIAFEKKGDLAAREETFKGWNLRTKWYQLYDGKEKDLTVSEVTSLSFDNLSNNLFDFVAPAGFHYVSDRQFKEAERKLVEDLVKPYLSLRHN